MKTISPENRPARNNKEWWPKSRRGGFTEDTAACITLEGAEGFSLSSGWRRGLGRGGSFCLRLACESAVGCPSPEPLSARSSRGEGVGSIVYAVVLSVRLVGASGA